LLISAGRYDEAASHCEKVSPGVNWPLRRARLWQGRTGDALQILETAFYGDDKVTEAVGGYLGYAYARAGRREDAEKLAAAGEQDPLGQSLIYAGLGDKDRTFEALDRAAGLGPARMGWRFIYPEYSFLRGDPRLKALRKKVGLPE
jgi:hypothetical protein